MVIIVGVAPRQAFSVAGWQSELGCARASVSPDGTPGAAKEMGIQRAVSWRQGAIQSGGSTAGTVSSEGTGDALDAENAESAKGGSSQVASEKGERGEEHAVVVVGAVKSEEAI